MLTMLSSRNRIIRGLSLLVFFASIFMFVSAGWIQIKAYTAQLLLNNAWSRTLDNTAINRKEYFFKPWSWADTWPVARMTVPKFNIDYLILDGMHGQSLAFGPGRVTNQEVFGENLPVVSSHVSVNHSIPLPNHSRIIAGHKDTHFKFLEHLIIGDIVRIQNDQGSWTEYTVSNTEVSVPVDGRIPISDSKNEISLITCYPFTPTVLPSDKRYIVTLSPAQKEVISINDLI